MHSVSYTLRRSQLETYFDRTAVEAWARLTSTAPVSGVRATVRAGRDRMRATLLSWLPSDLRGARILDAGCGTGALAMEAARRGADVLAVDLSPTLVALARARTQDLPGGGRITFQVGDMTDPAFGSFDHIVAMDSLIHYRAADMARVAGELAQRAGTSVLFTFAPRTVLLSVMHAAGRLFPRGDRAPAIEPVREATLRRLLGAGGGANLHPARTLRIKNGFYISQAMELARI